MRTPLDGRGIGFNGYGGDVMDWVWFALEIGLAIGALVAGIYVAFIIFMGLVTLIVGVASLVVYAAVSAYENWQQRS